MKIISIANDFSAYLGGRTPSDGPFSGEEFREKFLLPIFLSDDIVRIDLDGVSRFNSSFLEEAFGGLVRAGISKERILAQLWFKCSKPSIVEEIYSYV